jgi:hypothetical protein
MTAALSFDPLTQFSEFETQVGFSRGEGDSSPPGNWAQAEALMAEANRALRAGDTDRFSAILAELRAVAAPAAKPLSMVDASDWIETDPPALDPILEEALERTDKVSLIGSPKLRKSFFALQMALHAAAGMEFLVWKIPKPRKVLLVQTEMKAAHFHRRVKRMTSNLGITRAVIESNLRIVNARGIAVNMEEVAPLAKSFGAELIIFDPLYKLMPGDENAGEDVKPVLAAFDRLAEDTGAAVMYVHHDPKGTPGDRNLRDRGAGSNVLNRDYDCCIMLTAHRDDPNAAVVELLVRNYAPQEPFTIGWAEGSFRMADLPAVPAMGSKRSNPASAKVAEEYVEEAVALMAKPMSMQEFGDLLITRLGLTQKKARSVQDAVLRNGKLKRTTRRYEKGAPSTSASRTTSTNWSCACGNRSCRRLTGRRWSDASPVSVVTTELTRLTGPSARGSRLVLLCASYRHNKT